MNEKHSQAGHKSAISIWLSSRGSHWPYLEKSLNFCKAIAARPVALGLCVNLVCMGSATIACIQGLACWSYLSVRAITAANMVDASVRLVKGYPTKIYIKSSLQRVRRLCKERFKRYTQKQPLLSGELNSQRPRSCRSVFPVQCSSPKIRPF